MKTIHVRVYSATKKGTKVNSIMATTSMTVDEILKKFENTDNIYKIEIEPF